MMGATAGKHVRMVCDDLSAAPRYHCPDGYCLRWYRPGDERDWLSIHRVADVHSPLPIGIFGEQFGGAAEELPRRQVYLIAPSGEAVGTATAWSDSPGNRGVGRVHWVAIKPAYQGRGLSRPLLSAICRKMTQLGDQGAYLVTATGRVPALNLYFSFGFLPDIVSDGVSPWLNLLERNPTERSAPLGSELSAWLSALKKSSSGVP